MNSLVEVIESVGDANRHLHSSLRSQLLNGSISFFPKGLGVVLIRQTTDLPLLQKREEKHQNEGSTQSV